MLCVNRENDIMNIVYSPQYRHHSLIAKMREQNIKDFSNSELDRVFRNTVGPGICKRSALRMIKDGLTIDEIYKSLVYN